MNTRVRVLASTLVLTAIVGWGVVMTGAGAATADAAVAFGFDEGTGVSTADQSGRGRVGDVMSAVWTPSGRFGAALTFDGEASRVRTAAQIPLAPTFSVTAWVLNPTASGYETIVAAGAGRDIFLLNGRLYLYDGERDLDLRANVPTNRWAHLAVTSDGSSVRSFVDGNLIATVSATLAAVPAARLQIGAWPSSGGDVDFFSGTIDEVRWYERRLTQSEVVADLSTPVSSDSGPATTQPVPTTTTTMPATTTTMPTTTTTAPSGTNRSLQFFANGDGGIDRVRVPLTPNRSIDIGADFTIEWWMKVAGPLTGSSCGTYESSWIYGNIVLDRDVYGRGDNGDYGISVFGGGGGRIAFGVTRGSNGVTLCSSRGVDDGAWHHVAVTRSSTSGAMAIFVDGQRAGSVTGPTGDVSYRDGRSTSYANDPALIIGAEKHDAGASFPSYPGWLDELRISTVVRYTAPFSPPGTRLPVDANTVALYHADEGGGGVLQDATGANPGAVLVGGSPSGPVWSADTPF